MQMGCSDFDLQTIYDEHFPFKFAPPPQLNQNETHTELKPNQTDTTKSHEKLSWACILS